MALIKNYDTQSKAEIAYKFYLNKGYTPAQASAIVGNLQRESNFNTTIVGTADDKGSQGLAQWHSGRLNKLKSMYGEDWTNFENQLEFVDWELKNTHKAVGDKFKKAGSVWEAGRIFTDEYERPKVKFHADDTRQQYVADTYRKMGKMELTDADREMFKKTFAKDVAPYMNQNIIPTISNLDSIQSNTTFASVPDIKTEEKEQKTEAVDKLEQVDKEKKFLEEYSQIVQQQPQDRQEEQTQQAPPTDVFGIYNQVNQFVENPIVAQQGGKATRQDSLNVYNNSRQVENYYRKKGYESKDGLNRIYKTATEANNLSYTDFKDNHSKLRVNIENGTIGQKMFGLDNEDYRQNIDKNRYKQRERSFNQLDMGAPMQLFDKRIEPMETKTLGDTKDLVQIHTYNTIANKPFDLLTEKEKAKRVREYGRDGVPKSYKLPEDKINNLPQIRQGNSKDDFNFTYKGQKLNIQLPDTKRETPTLREKQTPLQQIQTKGLIESNQEINTPLANIIPQGQMAKYWDVVDTNNQRFGGGDTSYRLYPDTLNNLRELPEEGWSRKVTPTYQQGGLTENEMAFISQMYKDQVEVKKSNIEGKGAFAKEEFKVGDIIGLAHTNDQPSTTLGKFHNHSEKPNAESIKVLNQRYLKAIKNLKKGQEITVDYRKQPELEQPSDFKK